METRKNDLFWMRMCLSLAKSAAHIDEVPVGALIVCGNKLLSTGINMREHEQNPCAHSEILALQRASKFLGSWRLNHCTLYVSLEPCLMCAGAIYQSRIERVVYAASDPKAGALGSLYSIHQDERLNHRFSLDTGIEAESSAKLLRDFFRQKRHKKS